MKAKPIVLIQLKGKYPADEFNKFSKRMDERLTDYHVIVISGEVEETSIQVFYEKDFTKVKYEELKSIVKESII